MANLMQDQHRERIMEQIAREKNRQYQEQKMVELSREAKKNIRFVEIYSFFFYTQADLMVCPVFLVYRDRFDF